jgi:hypothetical protein
MSGRDQRPTSDSPADATSDTCYRNACTRRASRGFAGLGR